MTMVRIAVVGPGAVGGVVADALHHDARLEVLLAARTSFRELVVDTPEGTRRSTPLVVTRREGLEPADWVLIATKAYDSLEAARWLEALRAPHTAIAVLQNGVEHVKRFAPFAPAGRILPVMVDCPAERTLPGRVRLRRRARLVVPEGELGAAFVALFERSAIDVSESADFATLIWQKLCLNATAALGAIVAQPAEIIARAGIVDAMRGIVRECVAVGRAEGAKLGEGVAEDVISRLRAAEPDSVSSLLADRLARRRMEIDARNGAVVRIGREHGIETPLNALCVALLELVEMRSPALSS